MDLIAQANRLNRPFVTNSRLEQVAGLGGRNRGGWGCLVRAVGGRADTKGVIGAVGEQEEGNEG